jgi:hypothetical protein
MILVRGIDVGVRQATDEWRQKGLWAQKKKLCPKGLCRVSEKDFAQRIFFGRQSKEIFTKGLDFVPKTVLHCFNLCFEIIVSDQFCTRLA